MGEGRVGRFLPAGLVLPLSECCEFLGLQWGFRQVLLHVALHDCLSQRIRYGEFYLIICDLQVVSLIVVVLYYSPRVAGPM